MALPKDWIQQTASRSRELDRRAEETLPALSVAQLNWRPDKDTWSVAQQLHHMVLTNRPYADILETISMNAGPAKDEYKPGFMGRFLIKAVGPEESIPSPVPKPLVPSEQPMDGAILKEFLELQARFHRAVEEIAGKDLNTRFSSPFAKFMKLKIGDAIQIQARHNERHLLKAFKLLERSDFPK